MDTIWQPDLLDGTGPKYKAVAETIRGAISQGHLPVGAKLPPVRDLAWTLKITPGTVARAYTILTDEGAVIAEVGRGTFVAAPQTGDPDAPFIPIEVDVVPHNSVPHARRVNLFSPALPSIGQAGLIREALASVAQDPASGVMHYPGRPGAMPAKEAALAWLGKCPLGPLTAQDVILTLGGQHAIMLVMQAVLKGRKPTVLVEELAYPGFRRAAELLRAEVVGVEMDADGIIPEALEAACLKHDAQMLCTSPEVHNPTVGSTPLARRRALVAVAERCNLQIVEDDCYRMGAQRVATYRQLAPARGWYVSSIAKTVTPALRLGFAIGPQDRKADLRRTVEHGMFGLPTPMIDMATILLRDPRLLPLTQEALRIYGEYIEIAVTAFGPHQVQWRADVPFLWLTLPMGWRAGAFCQAAEAADAPVRSAEEFAGRDARAPHAVRLAVNAAVSKDSFGAAMMRLRDLLDNPPEQIGV